MHEYSHLLGSLTCWRVFRVRVSVELGVGFRALGRGHGHSGMGSVSFRTCALPASTARARAHTHTQTYTHTHLVQDDPSPDVLRERFEIVLAVLDITAVLLNRRLPKDDEAQHEKEPAKYTHDPIIPENLPCDPLLALAQVSCHLPHHPRLLVLAGNMIESTSRDASAASPLPYSTSRETPPTLPATPLP